MLHWIRNSIFVLAILLAVIQVVRPARTNPPIDPKQEIHSNLSIDPLVSAVFVRSCDDCHSNRTVWPWYSHVAPASWLLVTDVNRGRKALNLSEWSRYQREEQKKQLSEICKEVSEGEMPGFFYTLLHREAKLGPNDVATICTWTKSSAQTVSERKVSGIAGADL